ncbi:polysaccharide deacetylase [Skermanella stibiiresistens SB22]|uniref:Polysaccharide deacetylase n=1 Tax=Skermanella stibiiresistens SB22 TaxID=1385369 RepID=W9H381_9PROT|nr:polysaccharide deacetylase family protein [Skermanella stibiiresistens]EWY40630.1 polysaccharide deacetylase [Skermanella stibiiresistens SB22]
MTTGDAWENKAWDTLAAELDLWAEAGAKATLWWRDDDAVAPTPALTRLRAIATAHGVPVALAVIPTGATPELAEHLRGWPGVSVLQHGLSHANHETPPAKKAELGAARPPDAVLEDLRQGWRRLAGFDPLPVLVPPWNRIAADVIPRLPGLGYAGISTFTPRRQPCPAPGLIQVNTHVDVIDWRGGGGFAGTGAVIAATVRHLAALRFGTTDRDEPTGLLTHHLVHDDACHHFLDRFLSATANHPAVLWLAAPTVFIPVP